jgi:hypothetical protein
METMLLPRKQVRGVLLRGFWGPTPMPLGKQRLAVCYITEKAGVQRMSRRHSRMNNSPSVQNNRALGFRYSFTAAKA